MFSPSATVLLNTPGHAGQRQCGRLASALAHAPITTMITCAEPVDHCGHVFDAVLAVAVVGKDLMPGPFAGVLIHFGPVDRIMQEVSTGPPGDVAGAVGAAVVHADDGRRLTTSVTTFAITAASLKAE